MPKQPEITSQITQCLRKAGNLPQNLPMNCSFGFPGNKSSKYLVSVLRIEGGSQLLNLLRHCQDCHAVQRSTADNPPDSLMRIQKYGTSENMAGWERDFNRWLWSSLVFLSPKKVPYAYHHQPQGILNTAQFTVLRVLQQKRPLPTWWRQHKNIFGATKKTRFEKLVSPILI